jgi:hypothetical protein
MSARRVAAMAAVIGDAQGGPQGINDTATHGQRVRGEPLQQYMEHFEFWDVITFAC